jgi:oligopeptidase B
MQAPVAKKIPKVLKIHGYEAVDDYAWLRGDHENPDPEIRKFLDENNRHTESFTEEHKPLVDALYKEMLVRIKQDDFSVPFKNGEWWYFTRTEEGKQYPVFLRSETRDAEDAVVLLDQNEMSRGHEFFSISDFSPSDDGNLLAFATDTTGYRQYTLEIKDLVTGAMLPDRIERTTSSEWSADGNYIFVSQEDPVSKRTDKIWRHTVGTNENELVYRENDVLFNSYLSRSRDGKMLFIGSSAKTMDEYRYIAADDPTGEWRLMARRREGHQYHADFDDGSFFFVTNRDGAENFKVMRSPADQPVETTWTDFIPYNAEVKIEAIDFFRDGFVVSEVENGLEYLRVVVKKDESSKRIATPERVYTMSLGTNPDYDASSILYNYSSMITPTSTYEYNMHDGGSTLVKQQEIPSGYDKTHYVTERVWATARDGVKVPIVVMMKRETRLDGTAPMLLYAYGSYGISMTPNFNANRLSLVDRGFIYAVAQIRGGGELGEQWRLAGRMFSKMNTFNDFVDSAKWLVQNKYTSSDRLIIQGGSAGGLLMGAAVNMAPDLFHAAIAQVPFVDVMNTMIDDTLPLTTEEWIEWGNPRDDKNAWDYMAQYSPYDNVKAQPYPNMLIEVSLNDSQVPYWEGAKFAAKVRELKTNDSVILLKTNMGAGHGGSSGRYDRLKEIAFDYAYVLTQAGIDK